MAAAVECIWFWAEQITILDTDEKIEIKKQSILAS